jgi:signal transduction histidine kinase
MKNSQPRFLKNKLSKDAGSRVYYLFVLVTLGSFFITAATVFNRTHQMLKERIFSELQISVKAVDGMLDSFIEGKKGRVLDFCSDGIIKDGLTYYDPDDSGVGELVKQINHHLAKNKRVLDPYLENIMVLNLKGRVIFSSDQTLLGKDKSKKDYFLELNRYLRDKNLRPQNLNLLWYTSDIAISEDLRAPAFYLSAIVIARTTGLPLGLVVNCYKAEVLDKFIKRRENQSDKTGKVYIINKEGLLLTYPNFFMGLNKEVILKEKVTMESPIIGQADVVQILGVYKDFRQKDVLGAALLMDINNWIILAERDVHEVFSPLYELTRQIIIVGLASLLVIIGISVFMMNLQKRIVNKTRELEEAKEQMYQSGKMAAVGQLSSSVAHEINNPLTGVLNNAQLLKMMLEEKKDFSPEEARKILDVIEDSALRCVRMSRSLLDFSHKADSEFHPFSLNEAIDKVVVIIASDIKHAISIEKRLQPDLPGVLGDTQLIQQAIFDMFNNAKYAIGKKFLEVGGLISIKTSYAQASLGGQAKDMIELSISDNGIGIPKENMDKLFTPFFTTKPVGEGTGLGLSIIYDIITKHHGTITVESELGKGTTFKVSLPACGKC